MTNENNARVAVRSYADRAQADGVIRALQAAGFSNDHINVVARDQATQRDVAHDHHVGAGTGATIGIVEGAAIGLLAGLGGLIIPGIGALAVAGPIAGLLTGGITGGIAGALGGWGIDAAEAKGYEERVGAGDVLVAVRDDDPARVAEARRIMDSAGSTPTDGGLGMTGTMDAGGTAIPTAGAGMAGTTLGMGAAGATIGMGAIDPSMGGSTFNEDVAPGSPAARDGGVDGSLRPADGSRDTNRSSGTV